MGNVISQTASGDDKIKDVRSSKLNADALGGVWKSLAEAKLGPTLALLDKVEADIAKQSQTALPLIAAATAEKKKADLLVGRVHDDIWNALGRVASDSVFSFVFPGGCTYYTTGTADEQPDRMELLASLLESGILTKLPSGMTQGFAKEVQESAGELRKSHNAARTGRASLSLFGRIRTVLSRSGQVELAGLKRLYKAHGFTEAQIHAVIPDRPAPSSKKAGKPAAAPKPAEEPSAAAPKPAEAPTAATPKPAEEPSAAAPKPAEGPAAASAPAGAPTDR